MSNDAPKKDSCDYPQLAQMVVQASGNQSLSKLPAGLYIVATPIGNLGDISLRALMTLARVDRIACEDTRTSGGMLAKYGLKKPLIAYHDHNAGKAETELLGHIASGEAVALISDAGMPLIADPGYGLVRRCRAQGRAVTVIPGANAALTALAGAGLPTDQFHFAGFLPAKSTARKKAALALKNTAGSLVFYETPQRLAESLADLADIYGADRDAVVTRELTKLFEESRHGKLGELAAHYQTHEVKGEIVLLVAPAPMAEVTTATIESLLCEALKHNSLRDAVALVVDATDAKKGDVYALALKMDAGS